MNIRRSTPVLLALWAVAGAPLAAQTITVNTVDDIVDFPPPRQVAQLPGPDGKVSFSEAILAANNTPGPQTIEFAIPKDEWWLLPDVALLRQESLFLVTGDETTIDFSSQTKFTGDTNPNGNEVGIYGLEPNAWGVASILISGNRCVVKGLGNVWQRGYAVQISGNDNRVIGCVTDGGLYAAVYITGGFGGPSPHGNIVGGTEPGEANILTAGNSGVRIDGPADHNIVIGNFLTGPAAGVEVRGATQYGMIASANRIGGPTAAERNVIAGAGRYGEEGFPTGAQVQVLDADGTIIQGNYVGTTAAGDAPYPNQRGPGGITVRSSRDTLIEENLISGLRIEGVNHYEGQVFGVAIGLSGSATRTTIRGNLIGTDATGQLPVLTRAGISTSFFPGEGTPKQTLIGGPGPGDGNTIAFVERTGVAVDAQTTGVTISGNSIHDNGLLGIDLFTQAGGGVTPNDPGDTDAGGNNLQNFPLLLSANVGAGTAIVGTLDSTPNRLYTVEFFASAACDPSGHGEGGAYLGAAEVATDGAGHAEFDVVVGSAAPGDAITATATDRSTGDTSEFSACVTAQGEGCYPDFTGDGALDLFDFLAFVNEFNAQAGRADCTGDGVFDLFDFLCFVNAFNAGC